MPDSAGHGDGPLPILADGLSGNLVTDLIGEQSYRARRSTLDGPPSNVSGLRQYGEVKFRPGPSGESIAAVPTGYLQHPLGAISFDPDGLVQPVICLIVWKFTESGTPNAGLGYPVGLKIPKGPSIIDRNIPVAHHWVYLARARDNRGRSMPPNLAVRVINGVKVPMRDGTRLSTDLYLPEGTGPFPTVLMRTPYDNNGAANIEKGRRLANYGYAVAIQDCRGRFDSEGSYYPFIDEGVDGYDTQEWVGQQPWCNGKIGMAGASYGGWVQWSSALYRSRYLRCLAPRVMAADLFRGLAYPGGAYMLNVLMTWGMRTSGRTAQSIEYDNWREAFRLLPLREADEAAGRSLPFWKDWLDHPTYDEYWQRQNVAEHWNEFAAPSLNLGGWYDLYSSHTFEAFRGLRAHGGTPEARQAKLIVGPWPHALSQSTKTGDIDFGAPSQLDLEGLELRWFDYWLKGIPNGITDEPPIRLFVMGANTWRDEHEWPLARTDWQKWYLHSGGRANTLLGDGELSTTPPGDETSDTYTYHPAFPVQTVGGNNCCSPHLVPWGPYDQRDLEMRHDVLCYTSEALSEDLEVTGPIRVVLYAQTNCRDTDWTAKLVEVSPSGYAKNLCDGIIRARYRESMTAPTLLEPNQIYAYEIDLMVTSNVFRKGHHLRVEISSSNFPRFDRNLNTGLSPGTSTELRVAHQTILHTRHCPSHIILPVIPAQ